MSKKPQAKASPTTIQALGARNRVDVWLLAVERQHRRVAERAPERPAGSPFDPQAAASDAARHLSDIEFYIVALQRLQRAARLAYEQIDTEGVLDAALRDFEASVPDLTGIRNRMEHFDDYAKGLGHSNKDLALRGSGTGQPNPSLTVGGQVLWMGDLTAAARRLHRAVRRVVDPLAFSDPHGYLPIIEQSK